MLSRNKILTLGCLLAISIPAGEVRGQTNASSKVVDPASISFDQVGSANKPAKITVGVAAKNVSVATPQLVERKPSEKTASSLPRVVGPLTTPPGVAAGARTSPAESGSPAGGGLPDVNIAYPDSINLNVPAQVVISVTCGAAAQSSPARLLLTIPGHLDLVSATPAPAAVDGSTARYDLPVILAGKVMEIRFDVIAREKKPVMIGSRLELIRESQVSMDVREAVLQLSLEGAAQGVLGQEEEIEVVVRNTGDGIARELNIDLQVPEGTRIDETTMDALKRAGSLEPGQEKRIRIPARFHIDGTQKIVAEALALGARSQLGELGVNVIRPELELAVSAPEKTYLNSRAWYTFTVTNPTAIDIEETVVSIRVPGMTVQTISTEADYDPDQRSLAWTVGKLAAGQKAEFQMVAVANETGPLQITATLESQLTERKELSVGVACEARAKLAVSVAQLELPAPVGVPSKYSAVVENRGTEEAAGITVSVQLPQGWTAENSETCFFDGTAATFKISSLAPGERKELLFQATGNVAGENLFRAVVQHADSSHIAASEASMLLFQADARRVADTAKPRVDR